MLFLVVANSIGSRTKDEAVKIGKTTKFDFEGLHSEVLTDDCCVIQNHSNLIIYETMFPNQMLKSPPIDERVLVNLLDDTLRYFIVLDYSKKTITMAKSPSAAMSLYYHIDRENKRIFCSNRISFLREFGVQIRENKDVLPEFFVSRFVAPPNTMYEEIFQVAAGQKIQITIGEHSIKANTCLKYVPSKACNESFQVGYYSTRLLAFLTEALSKIFDLDENALLLLSGGIDTSVLAKIGIRLGMIKETFSTSYPFIDPKRDTEKKYALTAAKAFGISHKHFEASTEEFLESVIDCIAINEAPIQWPQSVMLYLLLSKGLPKESKIIINGLGADGLLGRGLFTLKKRIPFIKALSFLRLSKLCVHVLGFLNKDASIISKSLKKDFENPDNIIWCFTTYGDEDWICKTFGVSKKEIMKGRLRAMQDLENRSLFDIVCFLDWLEGTETEAIWNRLAKSAGKMFFYPFADRKLVDLCFTIPWNLKLREPKHIIRCIARELKIPDFIITRKKSGFGLEPYVKLWGTPGGVFASLVRFCREYFSDSEIRELQTGEVEKAATLWSMIMYSIWRKIMIENVPVSDLIECLKNGYGHNCSQK